MCGLNGIISFNDQAPSEAVLRGMNQCLRHRGPDNDGIYINGNTAFGHRRLAIIDLSDSGNQPFISPDRRFAIVFNGEIYNYRQLKNSLASTYSFETGSDTEVLLAAWLKWGTDCIHKLEGMFAFAVHDSQSGESWLVRDRIGIKPMYYAITDQGLVFSSEIRAILKSGLVKRKLDPVGLVDYFRYQTVHAPNTMVEQVKVLQAGHYMHIAGEEEIKIRKYWDITSQEPGVGYLNVEDVRKGVRERFFSAVEKRLVADVPFGAFLSGGIDSTAVVAAMSQVASGGINTFSVVFDEKEFSEAQYARLVAKKFGTKHEEIRLTPADFLEMLPAALGAIDHPSGDGPNTYVVSEVTRKAGITMALSGLGGDELFAGYDVFTRSARIADKRWLQSYPPGLRRMAGSALKFFKPGVASSKIAEVLALDYFDIPYTYPLSRQIWLDKDIMRMLNTRTLPENSVRSIADNLIAYGTPGFDLPFLSKISVMEMSTYMQHVLLRDTDQMSMAHALEVRVPFLDHDLVRFVLSVPDQLKYPYSPKKLLVESLGELIPDEVVNRQKMGFTFPWAKWMKHELRPLCDTMIKNLGQRSFMKPGAVERNYQRFLKDDPRVTWSRIWPLVVLENWLETNEIEH